MRLVGIYFAFLIALSACGSSGLNFPDDVPTDSPPVVSRVDPTAGAAGSQVTIFGLGFSDAAPNNIVVIGDAAVSATGYRLLDNPTSSEIEALTATVPTDATAGANSVAVVVYDNTSNSDVQFTVTP